MIFQKEKSIKVSDYLKIIKPNYVYIQVTPHKSIRNYNSSNIAKAIAYTYKTINKQIKFEQKKLFFETSFKISYIIDIYQCNANFYFLVPEIFKNILIEKIKEIWTKATISVLVGGLMPFTENMEMYQLSYKKEDALSLQVDRKSNEPLNSILNVMDIMKDEDRVTIVYNFIPSTQFGWIDKYNQTMDKIKEMKPVDKNKLTFASIAINGIYLLLNVIDSVLSVINDFVGGEELEDKNSLYKEVLGVIKQEGELSAATKKKKDATILNAQIAILADGEDKTRKENNALSVCQAYRVLDEDNELTYKKVKRKKEFDINEYDFNIEKNIMSTEEASNFIQIPGRTLLNYFNINHIKVEEVKIPEQLKSGYICLGNNKNKGTISAVYLEDDYDVGSLPLMILGRQGGGKSTYLANYCRYAMARDESIFVIDFIKNNEMTKDIESVVPKDKLVILDFSDIASMQSLAYNELKFKIDTFENRYEVANKKSQLTLELVNSININGEPFSPKMERFLIAACDIVFTLDENATFKDIIRCLTDYKYREDIINSLPKNYINFFEEDIASLEELDEWSRPSKDNPAEKIGTRESKIEGILDRMTLLKRDYYLKMMFNKTPENNVNFVDLMEEGKVVLIRMPQSKFKKYVKNVIATFLITKLWTSAEIRGDLHKKPTRSHIIIDELSQVKTAENYLDTIITETRKYGFKPVLSGQRLFQLEKNFIEDLKGAGASFMLLKGSLKEDFEYFKEEIGEDFTYEDLTSMEKWSSLNVIQYSEGYSSFITKLPKPI